MRLPTAILVWSTAYWLAPFGPAAVQTPAHGSGVDPFAVDGNAAVLFFVASDCPVSNGYAPVVQAVCGEYKKRGVACSLVYEDPGIEPAAMRAHMNEYGYSSIRAVIDVNHGHARRAGATVTPEVVVIDRKGAIRYCGRIDNRYADLGKPRRVVTVHDLRDALEAILAGRPVRTPETTPIGCFIESR